MKKTQVIIVSVFGLLVLLVIWTISAMKGKEENQNTVRLSTDNKDVTITDVKAQLERTPLRKQAEGQGDAVALEIIRDNAVKMTGLVGAVARQLGIKAGKVAMLGGLLEHDTKLRETFVAEMGRQYPALTCTEPEQDAAAGALMLAKEML